MLETGLRNGEDLGHIHLLSNYASNRYGRNVAMLSACDKIHRMFGTEFEPIVLARSFGFQAVNASEAIKVRMNTVEICSLIYCEDVNQPYFGRLRS